MKSILDNPYRILGLLAGASTREINKQVNRLQRIISAEQNPPTDDYSFPTLGKLTRTINSITEAYSKLNLDNDKMHTALFWFYKGNDITDEPAFEALKEGDIDTAYNIWDRLISSTNNGSSQWRQTSERNSSAFHNYCVLEMIRANGNKHNAIVSNLYFLESESYQKFVSSVTDSTFRTTKKELEISFLNEILQEIIQKTINLTISQFVEILNKVSFIAKEDFFKSISQKFITNLSAQLEISRTKRTANKANAAKAGEELYKQTKNDLEQLESIVGVQDFAYSNVADKVANEILQCSIDFFNHSQDINANNDYHNVAIKLARLAEGIAVGRLAKERVKDNISTIEEMKDREILHAITLLQSIKDVYETKEREVFLQIANKKKSLRYGESIDMFNALFLTDRSIAWDKVVSLIKQEISPQNVEKIKKCKNSGKIKEYRTLVDFLISKLQLISIIYPIYSNTEYLTNKTNLENVNYLTQLTHLEKSEQELKNAEQKLEDIKISTPFSLEINIANNKMNAIQGFHPFRSSTEKERQIEDQQRIIDSIRIRSENERRRQIVEQEEIIYKLRMDIRNVEY